MTRPQYPAATRDWVIEQYRTSRQNYASRAECIAALAPSIGAHENTVARWIAHSFGPAREPAADDITGRLRASEAENERLRRENRLLTEQLAARSHASMSGRR